MIDSEDRTRRPRILVMGIIIGVLALAVIGFVVSIPLVNDAAAREVKADLLNVPLPDGAERVDSMSQAGKLVGNGNGMQYLGALLIRSDQQRDELQAFYDQQEEQHGLAIMVSATTDFGLDQFHGAKGFFAQPGEEGLFVVYSWGEGPGWFYEEFDLRGR